MSGEDAMAPAELRDRDSDLILDQERRGVSDDVVKQLLEVAALGPRSASGTVRKFVDILDTVAPLDRVGLAKRREVIAAALEMTQRLVHTPYDVGRSLVQSAVLVNVDVDVDVDVDIASQPPTTQINREEV
jgi:hypothetical protein